mmetsp:Transcript_28764/g.68520  ORF Transcript_28764/g.68520 Transcript_28764/m.68520 type:complete len:218 (-) Transcript_28764:60-713(-)
MLSATCRFLALCLLQTSCAFRPSSQLGFSANTPRRTNGRAGRSTQSLFNYYDDWATDSNSRSVYDELTLPLDEESIAQCLDELVMSEYGKQMFGVHDMCASVGITGSIEFVELDGPEVLLSLAGQFWHRRETVLGKAAIYLNARIPEITSVRVSDPADLEDFEDIVDDLTGEILYTEDKRSEDFNGDRGTMEYQGIDPDVRGPFVFSPSSGGMIRPA